jgi:hypothetical protein
MGLADLPLLLHVLQHPGGGLIAGVGMRVSQLEAQLRAPTAPSEQHRKLIAAATRALQDFGKKYRALREHEGQHVGAFGRHEFRGPRAACGFSFGHIDATTLQRVAEFGQALPVDSK